MSDTDSITNKKFLKMNVNYVFYLHSLKNKQFEIPSTVAQL